MPGINGRESGETDRDLSILSAMQFTKNCVAYNIIVLNIINLKNYNVL
jgi:hypothetical protein